MTDEVRSGGELQCWGLVCNVKELVCDQFPPESEGQNCATRAAAAELPAPKHPSQTVAPLQH